MDEIASSGSEVVTFEGNALFMARYQVNAKSAGGEAVPQNDQGLFLAPSIDAVIDALRQMFPEGVTVFSVQLAEDGADVIDAREEWKQGT